MTRTNHWRRENNGGLVRCCDKSLRMTGPVTLRSYPGDNAAHFRHCAQAAYAPYIRRFGKPPMPMLDDYADLPGDREVYVAATSGEGIAGFLILNPTGERMVLENMAVHPDAQGAGLGGRMMDLAEVRAKALGYPEIELYTHRDLTEIRALYLGRGYSEVFSDQDYGSQRIHLKKTLG
jgi:ribosomal protein S18 acetylase RimI-like enzyme